MLRQLRIENLVLARDVLLDFAPGLNLITGETGAGKSLITGALALACGARGEAALVRQGTRRAVVEALFDLSRRPDLVEKLHRSGYSASGDEMLIRREIGSDGRSKALLGGSPVTVALLREITGDLVEVHGQHEPQALFQPETQRDLLDRAGDHDRLLTDVRRTAALVRELDARLSDLRERARARESRIEILQFRLAEFDRVRPEAGDEERLRVERERLRHAEEIGTAIQAAIEAIYEGDEAAHDRIHAAARRIRAQGSRDEEFIELAERLDDVRAQIAEITGDLRAQAEALAPDPARLEQVEERLHALERLRRRFDGAPTEDIIASAEAMRRELEELSGQDEEAAVLAADLDSQLEAYARAADKLHQARVRSAERLARSVGELLAGLAMEKARVRIEVEYEPPRPGQASEALPAGRDKVEFLLQANPGEPARPLRKVASGGELSRVMLALDIALEGRLARRTLLFDEVDQGLGGEAADRLASFLQRVAESHQVISITHLPQVAACAARHIHVSKKVRAGRTVAVVRSLEDEEDRVEELARMIGGKMVTDTARRHAEAMLASATSFKETP
ncbi:MAG: DNA repair protein RecN [Acidobacteriota bacterium]|nr:DNA repair protein RecN [Acidobacteriota bacterium]